MVGGKRLKRGLESLGFTLLTTGVRRLPRRRALALGAGLGRFAFDRGIRRTVAVENVRAHVPVSGPRDAERIARESYQVMARTFVDLLRADLMSDEALWKVVSREQLEPYRQVHAQGRGGLLVSGHFGNWELMLVALRRLGVPVAAMAGDQSNPRVDRAIRRLRLRAGITPLSARSGLRDAVRILRSGGFVATLMDQDARRKGIFSDFLGTPASTHTGVLSLALRTGAPVVPGVAVDEGDRYTLRLADVWNADPSLAEEENLRIGVEHYNRFLEEEVLRVPGNYFWAHRRWKTRPLQAEGRDVGS